MKPSLMTMCGVVLAVSTALSAQKKAVPPQPKPADQGPSLAVTAKFIQDKLNEEGNINYQEYTHDSIDGKDVPLNNFSFGVPSFEITEACGYTLKQKWALGQGSAEKLATQSEPTTAAQSGSLSSIKSVRVTNIDDWLTQELINENMPSKTARVVPELFVLRLIAPPPEQCTENGRDLKVNGVCPTPFWAVMLDTWRFHDVDTANRVAKAVVHAVELCGGGSPPEPF
jgi:hypothetical protein